MKTVYEAANGVEAHMLCDLMQQEGIEAFVRGAALQGAMGDLPAAGLVRIEVDEADWARARELVEQWEARDNPPAPPSAAKAERGGPRLLPGLVLGLALGALGIGITWAYFRSPTRLDGVDYNHDGQLDERWTYTPSGTPVKYELDRNLDDRIDYITRFDERGLPATAEADDDFNGVFETRIRFKDGQFDEADSDTDGDGVADTRTHYTHGVPTSMDYFNPDTGLPLRIDYFKLGKLTHSEVDTDRDGKPDTRIDYTPLHEVSSTHPL